jgi:hypothetical protein
VEALSTTLSQGRPQHHLGTAKSCGRSAALRKATQGERSACSPAMAGRIR